jgi:hypothetical protein
MTREEMTIGPLMKVGLALRVIPPEPLTNKQPAVALNFIYGIGISGLTPFEKALAGKSQGDDLQLEVPSDRFAEIFGHLGCSLAKAVTFPTPWQMEITVVSLEKAENRELIKAMAEMSGCGGNCGCGCS